MLFQHQLIHSTSCKRALPSLARLSANICSDLGSLVKQCHPSNRFPINDNANYSVSPPSSLSFGNVPSKKNFVPSVQLRAIASFLWHRRENAFWKLSARMFPNKCQCFDPFCGLISPRYRFEECLFGYFGKADIQFRQKVVKYQLKSGMPHSFLMSVKIWICLCICLKF